MAYSSFGVFSSSLLSLLLFLLMSVPSYEAFDLITQVCNITTDPPICIKYLTADPETSKAVDLKGLGNASIDLVNKNVAMTAELAKDLGDQATNRPLKLAYYACIASYNSYSTHGMVKARQALLSADIRTFKNATIESLRGPEICDRGFHKPLVESLKLKGENTELKFLINIVYCVGVKLS